MTTNYPIPEYEHMLTDQWLRDRVQEIRWDLGLDLDTRPEEVKDEEED